MVEWSKDAVNWAKTGAVVSSFSVLEIGDPTVVPFPGFDDLVLTYGELQDVVDDPPDVDPRFDILPRQFLGPFCSPNMVDRETLQCA